MDSKNVIIVAIAVILCVAIATGAYAYLSIDSNSNADDSNSISESDDSILPDLGDILNIGPSLEIMNTTIYTGHSLSAKTFCTINVKADNVEDVVVKVTYSRDGAVLGDYEYNATIDNNSNIILESIDSFKKYPDNAIIEIYTTDGDLLDSVNIKLHTDDSTQLASGNGNVTAVSVTVAEHSASSGDAGAFYSYQDGRTIHTGEVQLAPDGHHWKHLGYNEWVKID